MDEDRFEKKHRQSREQMRRYRERWSQVSAKKFDKANQNKVHLQPQSSTSDQSISQAHERRHVKETTPERQARLAAHAQSQALRRARETTPERQARRAANAEAQARRRARETTPERQARRAANAQSQARRRAQKLALEREIQLSSISRQSFIIIEHKINLDTMNEWQGFNESGVIEDSNRDKKINHLTKDTNDKPYKCELCGKAFTTRCRLKYHTRIHTGEKPYKCRLCQKSFASSSYLKIHERKHTLVKPYKCELYSKDFIQEGHLNRHSSIHSGAFYNNGFGTVDSLLGHARTQPIENECMNFSGNERSYFSDIQPFLVKPYGCGICDEMFEIQQVFLEHCYELCYCSVDVEFAIHGGSASELV